MKKLKWKIITKKDLCSEFSLAGSCCREVGVAVGPVRTLLWSWARQCLISFILIRSTTPPPFRQKTHTHTHSDRHTYTLTCKNKVGERWWGHPTPPEIWPFSLLSLPINPLPLSSIRSSFSCCLYLSYTVLYSQSSKFSLIKFYLSFTTLAGEAGAEQTNLKQPEWRKSKWAHWIQQLLGLIIFRSAL